MTTRTRHLSLMSLAVMAMAITACGTTPQVADAPAPMTGSAGNKLVTLRVGPGVSSAGLKASLPGAQVLVLDHATSRAVVTVPATTARTLASSSLSAQRLGQLDAGVLAVEDDSLMKVLDAEDPEAGALGLTSWAGGLTTWAGGLTTWAGGALSWAGGTSFLNSADLASASAYWNTLGIFDAQRRIPELGDGVRVAVLDTGIDLNHPLLRDRVDTMNDWDFVAGDATPQEENPVGALKYGHGTAVAGVILQIAPKASIQAYRVLNPNGAGRISLVTSAVNKAVVNGAQIINMSLGSTTSSIALNTALAAALAKGVLIVNSSGNAGTQGIVYPGAALGTVQFPLNSGLMSVGSVDLTLKKSKFSQYARNMTLTAPGELVLTTFPDSRLVKASGTSFAAPAVTGALALAMSAGASSSALTSAVQSSATPNLDATYNTELGAGTLNVSGLAAKFR